MSKLNDLQLRGWRRAAMPIAKSDGGGLTFTVSGQGTAAWVLRYRFATKARELTLGRYPDISLADARKLAMLKRAEIQKGLDVAREKQKTFQQAAGAMSFRQLADDYDKKVLPNMATSTVKQRRCYIKKHLNPALGLMPAREVGPADLVRMIERIGLKSRTVAEAVLTAASEIFKHGMKRHVVTSNPCATISATAIVGKAPATRERIQLTLAELRQLLPALGSLGRQNELTVRILLATCVRINELARARWSDVDLNKGEWTIPDHNSKTKRGFVVPLVPDVIGWFRELATLACGSEFVLPARQQRRRSVQGRDTYFEQRAVNAVLTRLCTRLGDKCRAFTPHDLRSTARSHLAALGVNIIVAERCLNHALGGLIGVYDKHDYLIERRSALESWTKLLLSCEQAGADNVVPLYGQVA